MVHDFFFFLYFNGGAAQKIREPRLWDVFNHLQSKRETVGWGSSDRHYI
jgi:hypothetical protein